MARRNSKTSMLWVFITTIVLVAGLAWANQTGYFSDNEADGSQVAIATGKDLEQMKKEIAQGKALLQSLQVKEAKSEAKYHRVEDFGIAWMDVDGNGCDTRNDILSRDLTNRTYKNTCKVASGILNDPYTGEKLVWESVKGHYADIQIDHVVALSNAWQTGAEQLILEQREQLANDPDNLLAVDGKENMLKGNGFCQKKSKGCKVGGGVYIPPNPQFRVQYVLKSLQVKKKYNLWLTPAEYKAFKRVLNTVPEGF